MSKKKNTKISIAALAAVSLIVTGASPKFIKAEEQNPEKKSETVYVIADASGDAREVIVSDRLSNTEGQEKMDM